MNHPGRLTAFVLAVAAAAGVALALPPTWTYPHTDWLIAAITFTVFGLLLEFVEVPLPHNGTLSVSGVAHVAMVLIVPPPFAAISVGVAVLAHQAALRQSPLKALFNVANHVLAVSLAGLVAGTLGSPAQVLVSAPLPLGYTVAVAAAAVYYTVNVGLTALVVSLATGRRLRYVMRANNRSTLLPDLGSHALGALVAASWYAMPAWIPLLAVPTAVIARTLRIIRRLERETVQAIETLADSIDDRDATTFQHSHRTAEYAVALANAMDLDDELVDLIASAARVHDLGKMGVTDRILQKPASLGPDEETVMRQHPEIGARILGNYELYRRGVELVRAHHERWDGQGYPDGLAGERIPLGARVIAVADAFDAMTSDRPYRAALSPGTALEELRRGAGSQWDPVVVAHFVRLLTDPSAEIPATMAHLRVSRPIDAAAGPIPLPVLAPLREAS